MTSSYVTDTGGSGTGESEGDGSTDGIVSFADLTGIYIDPNDQVENPGGGNNHTHLMIAPSGNYAQLEYDSLELDYIGFCFGQLRRGSEDLQIQTDYRCKESRLQSGGVTDTQRISDYSLSGSFTPNSRVEFTSGSLSVASGSGDWSDDAGISATMQDGDKFTYEFSNNSPIPTDSNTNMATNDASLNTLDVDQNANVVNTTLKPGYYYESWFSENPEERFIIKVDGDGTIQQAVIDNPEGNDDGSFGCKMNGEVDQYPISDVVAQTVMIMDATVSVSDCDGDWASDQPEEQFWHLANYSNRSAIIEPFRYAPFLTMAGEDTASPAFWLIASDEQGTPRFYEFIQFCRSDGVSEYERYQCEYQSELGIYKPVVVDSVEAGY